MEHTTTAADESAGNGRVESEIAHIKHHTKLLLTTSKAPASYWPMALRHASEYRFRKTLEQLGVPVPKLVPFGTEAIAKSKFWQRTMKGFPTPMQKVRVWGPAVGMSISSKGYWIEADGKRRFTSKKPLIPGTEDAQLKMRMLCSNRGECWSEVPNSWCGGSGPTTSLPDTRKDEAQPSTRHGLLWNIFIRESWR